MELVGDETDGIGGIDEIDGVGGTGGIVGTGGTDGTGYVVAGGFALLVDHCDLNAAGGVVLS